MLPHTSLVETSRLGDIDGIRAGGDKADGPEKPLPRRTRTLANGRAPRGNRKVQDVDEERMEVEPLANGIASFFLLPFILDSSALRRVSG